MDAERLLDSVLAVLPPVSAAWARSRRADLLLVVEEALVSAQPATTALQELSATDTAWDHYRKQRRALAVIEAADGFLTHAQAEKAPRLIESLLSAQLLTPGPHGCALAVPSPTRAHPDEIPQADAVRAFAGTSQFPEQRAEGARREYAQSFNAWAVSRPTPHPDDAAAITQFIIDAKNRYLAAFRAYLYAHAATTSWHVTGPAGRNEAREQKKHDTADRRMADARGVLQQYSKYIRDYLKRAAIARAGGEAAIAARRAERVEARPGASSRQAREAAERAAELEAREEATGVQEFPVEKPAHGVVTYDHDDNRIRIVFVSRIPREDYARFKAHGWHWARTLGALSRQLTNDAIRSARELTGADLPWLARSGTVAAASEAAAQRVQEARKERKAAARAGEGALGDVLDAAMRKRARFKLDGIAPSVSKAGAGYALLYDTGEKAPLFQGGGAVAQGRQVVVGFAGGRNADEPVRIWLYPNRYYPHERVMAEVGVNLGHAATAADVERILDAVAALVKTQKLADFALSPTGRWR